MLYIQKKELDIIKNLIISLDIETCGFFNQTKNSLLLDITNYGTKITLHNGETIGMCTQPHYNSKFIWHTHSSNYIQYPSNMDIINLLIPHLHNKDNNYPYIGFIFTSWGIWEVYFPYTKLNMRQEEGVFLEKILNESFYGLYHITNKGKILTVNTLPFLYSILNSINYTINNTLNLKDKFNITFVPWIKIKNNYKIQNKI